MTLQELYSNIGGDYEQALKTLRIEKLIDKHIRKLPANTIFSDLFALDAKSDENKIFECAHAVKGVCANLALVKMSTLSSDICDEFRPDLTRKFNDEQVNAMIKELHELFDNACRYISDYEKSSL